MRPKFLQYTATPPKAVAASAPRGCGTCPCLLLTFTEDKIRGDVEGLEPHFGQQELHGLLVVAGDEGDGLLRLALVGAPGGGDQGREAVRGGRVLPGWPGDTDRSGPAPKGPHEQKQRTEGAGEAAAAQCGSRALLPLECPPGMGPCFCVTPHTARAAPTQPGQLPHRDRLLQAGTHSSSARNCTTKGRAGSAAASSAPVTAPGVHSIREMVPVHRDSGFSPGLGLCSLYLGNNHF